ncbi:hypothetical protein L1987_85352 [Smallanthus sonchifolius]|uniref:Uncharacterized protein n=1 Tax=Smallanthus sonchifolius TaxID=185202 RepID=A0ACB8XVM9_9ASTR|nr:hypothetical protein L1987_85352 [Smallanthus sonchifolius]
MTITAISFPLPFSSKILILASPRTLKFSSFRLTQDHWFGHPGCDLSRARNQAVADRGEFSRSRTNI